MDSQIIQKYFPELSTVQKQQFAQLGDLYADWNAKINVVSRKDIDSLYEHHVLHSLAIAQFIQFVPHSTILDVGTGGGFPGIPLAILFPECRFVLIDSIGKKVRVAQEVADAIGLKNVEILHRNAKEERRKFDFVVSRAVMLAPELVQLIKKNISPVCKNAIPNGLLCLKGGDVEAEGAQALRQVKSGQGMSYQVANIAAYFQEEYFETKKVLYVPLVVE